MNLYVQCSLISLLGLALSVLTIIKSLTAKAKVSNVIFNWKTFLSQDIPIQAAGTAVTIGMCLILLGPFLKQYPQYANNTLFILIVFATIAYVGSDIASRFFSVVNSRINQAIDVKTSAADAASGNLNAPTPAAKPEPVKP
jgi:hypothetical protein